MAAVYAYDPLGRRASKSGTGVAATQFLPDGVEASREAWPRWGRVSPEKGLYSYRARYYAPKIGRPSDCGGSAMGARLARRHRRHGPRPPSHRTSSFLQTDPVGYDAGLHLYAYVGNDPVNRTDPIGTQTQCGSRLKARKDKNGKTVELGSASCRSVAFGLRGNQRGEDDGVQPHLIPQAQIDDVVKEALDTANPQSVEEDREIGGIVFVDENGVVQTTPVVLGPPCQGDDCGMTPLDALKSIPPGSAILGVFHTHAATLISNPRAFFEFSRRDVAFANSFPSRFPTARFFYLGNPQGFASRLAPGQLPANANFDARLDATIDGIFARIAK